MNLMKYTITILFTTMIIVATIYILLCTCLPLFIIEILLLIVIIPIISVRNHNTDGLQTVFSLSLHQHFTMFPLYSFIDTMTLHIDYHLDDFPGNNNLPYVLFKCRCMMINVK